MDKNNFGGYDVEAEAKNEKPSIKPDKHNLGDFDEEVETRITKASKEKKVKEPKIKSDKEPNDNKKKKNVILIIIIAVALAVAAFAIYNIVSITKEDADNKSDYATLQSLTQMDKSSTQAADGTYVGVDFSALKTQNEDICAWLYIDKTQVNYPVVYKDNSYYLNKNALKNPNRGGAIFIEESNKSDFSDTNTIVYGHNMNDGSMFAALHEYENEDYFNKNNTIEITTPTKKSVYKVFAAYVTSDTSDTYTIAFNEGEYAPYLEKMQANSTFKNDTVLDESKSIITLSTCVKGQDEKRYVVQGILQSEEAI